VHCDRAAVDIGITALKTAVLINAGALVALLAFVGQLWGSKNGPKLLLEVWSVSRHFVSGLINDLGEIVGESLSPSSPVFGTAFLWTRSGGMEDLGFGGNARSINDEGEIAGDYFINPDSTSAMDHAFIWTKNSDLHDLGTLGGRDSTAFSINSAGDVVGDSTTASGADHAFLWTDTAGMQDLGTLGGSFSRAFAVNDRGQVVGESWDARGIDHAFLWTATGGMQDLGTGQAYGINDSGEVVGSREGDAFLWTSSSGMQDLGHIGFTAAYAINNAGQIVGYDSLPEPTALVLVGTAVLLMSTRMRQSIAQSDKGTLYRSRAEGFRKLRRAIARV
jgi:probable HAF family extracellular repeat protein